MIDSPWIRLTAAARLRWIVGLALAGIATASGLVMDAERAFSALLVAGFFGASLALGLPLLAAVLTVCGARWWRPWREVVLFAGRSLPVSCGVIFVTLAAGLWLLYPWADPEVLAHSELLRMKSAWLSPFFFLARAAVILLLWLGVTGSLMRSLEGDGAEGRRPRPVRAAAIFLVTFVFTISIASWDWLMSLEPEWFSTMYGVSIFAGFFLGAIAALTVMAVSPLGRRLGLPEPAPPRRHDLGKMLFAFSMFWAYIWFCQFMLIWYASIPEETTHYALRWQGGWTLLFWLNPILNFAVPFAVLLPVASKRHPTTLVQVALCILAGRWLDQYLLIAPARGEAPSFPVFALVATLGVLAGMIVSLTRTAPAESTREPEDVPVGGAA